MQKGIRRGEEMGREKKGQKERAKQKRGAMGGRGEVTAVIAWCDVLWHQDDDGSLLRI